MYLAFDRLWEFINGKIVVQVLEEVTYFKCLGCHLVYTNTS